MKLKSLSLPMSFVFFGCLPHWSCGKKEDDTPKAAPSANLRMAIVAGGAASTSSFNLADVPFSGFVNGSIASGAPDEMSVSITKISLANSSTNSETPIFSEPTGKPLTIEGSRVDISSFFTKIECLKEDGTIIEVPEGKTCKCGVTAAGELIQQEETTDQTGAKVLSCPPPKEGEIPPFAVLPVEQTGDYDVLKIEYLNRGEASGCVSGKFASGDATHCTKTGKDLDAAAATIADFPATGPTPATIYWSKAGKGMNSFNKSYPIGSTISITADDEESPKLTFLIDRGRLLRFFTGTTSQGPNPVEGLPGSRAYFFSTVFEDSTYVFVGQPGNIRGYRYAAYVAKNKTPSDSFPAAGSRSCTSNCSYVNGWMTIVEDKDGKPFAVSMMPDDDNSFTVSKGSNALPNKPGSIDSSKITVNSDKTWTLQYSLFGQSGKGLAGTFYKLNPELAVGTSQTIEMEAEYNDSQPTQPFRTWGEVTLQRGL